MYREELNLKKSSVKYHVQSAKHQEGKSKFQVKHKRKQDIGRSITGQRWGQGSPKRWNSSTDWLSKFIFITWHRRQYSKHNRAGFVALPKSIMGKLIIRSGLVYLHLYVDECICMTMMQQGSTYIGRCNKAAHACKCAKDVQKLYSYPPNMLLHVHVYHLHVHVHHHVYQP